MPAATSKDQLLELVGKEYDKLERIARDIDARDAMVKDDDDTSIKDVIAHRARWIELFLGWYHDGLAGEEVHFPAKGYKWNELKRYNADLRDQQRHLDWNDACTLLATNHARLVEFLSAASDDDLYAGPMVGANNQWTPGRWAEAAGPSHYRSAAKYVRAQLRIVGTQTNRR